MTQNWFDDLLIYWLSIVFVQIDVNKVHNSWSNGSLEHSRQSDILPGDSSFSEYTNNSD